MLNASVSGLVLSLSYELIPLIPLVSHQSEDVGAVLS